MRFSTSLLIGMGTFALAQTLVSCGGDNGGGGGDQVRQQGSPSPTPRGSGDEDYMAYRCTSSTGHAFTLRIYSRARIEWRDSETEIEFTRTAQNEDNTPEHYTYQGQEDDAVREIDVPRPMVDDGPATSFGRVKEGSGVYECNREGGLG